MQSCKGLHDSLDANERVSSGEPPERWSSNPPEEEERDIPNVKVLNKKSIMPG